MPRSCPSDPPLVLPQIFLQFINEPGLERHKARMGAPKFLAGVFAASASQTNATGPVMTDGRRHVGGNVP